MATRTTFQLVGLDASQGAGVETSSRPLHEGSPVFCILSSSSVDALTVIEKASNPAPWSKRLFEEEFRNPHARVYGARLGGELFGFLVLHEILDEGHILDFGILPAYRRNGFGKKMLQHVLEDTASRGIRWVTLEVRRSNEGARRLYEGFCFNQVGVRDRYYSDNQEDALVMKLSVDDFISQQRYRLGRSDD